MPYDYYEMGAARGRAVGQGLMGLGQITAGAFKRQRDLEEKKFTKTVSLMGVYSKMLEGLKPEQRQQILTGVFLPQLAKLGGLNEIDTETIKSNIALFAAQNDKERKEFVEDLQKVSTLLNEGKVKEAKKFYGETVVPQGIAKDKSLKSFFDYLGKAIESDIEDLKGKEKEIRKETRGQAKEVREGLMSGDLVKVMDGEEEKYLSEGRELIRYESGLYAGRPKGQAGEPKTIQYTHKKTGQKIKVTPGSAKDKELQGDINFVRGTLPASRFAPEKPDMKESDALSKISRIVEAIQRFKITGGMDDPVFGMLSTRIQEAIRGVPKEEVIKVLTSEKQYLLDKFVSDETKKKYGYGEKKDGYGEKKGSWKDYR